MSKSHIRKGITHQCDPLKKLADSTLDALVTCQINQPEELAPMCTPIMNCGKGRLVHP